MSFFIFPHQLFNNLDYLNKDDKIYLIGEIKKDNYID